MLANVTIGPVITVTVEDVTDSQKQGETRMVSRNLKRFVASNGTVALVLTGMLVLMSGPTAKAQSEGAGSRQGHQGLQGAWRLQVTVVDCYTRQVQRTFPALAAFAKRGTLTVTTAGQSPALSTTGVGLWRRTEDHRYSAVSESFVFSPAGVWIQTHRLTRAIDVDIDGDEFTDTVALEILDTGGNVVLTGCATSVGSRFKLESIESR
jgi:hypothetical protein